MDPLSITLAVLPLLISTAEHYKGCYDALHRLRKASREAEHLRIDLVVQRSLFDDSCRHLLGQCGVNEATVRAMLDDREHGGWSEMELQSKIKSVLGSFYEAFVGVLRRIDTELRVIQDEVHRCYSIDRNIGWRARLAAKKPTLDRLIEQVNRLNINLNDIRTRTDDANRQKLSQSRSPARVKQRPSNRSSRHPLQEAATVRQISQDLYEALARACAEHEEHNTLINLTPRINMASKCVRFELALQDPEGHSRNIQQVAWLTFESLQKQSVQPVSGSVRKLRFVSVNEQTATRQRDFCRKLGMVDHTCLSRSCIGFFHHNEDPELGVYMTPKVVGADLSKASTLRELFSQKSPDERRVLNQFQCIRLARKLATALLNLHSTSWLSPSWNSQRVLLIHPVSSTEGIPAEQEPYLDVVVTASEAELGKTLLEASDPQAIENSFLFRLGVLLLELAFEQGLQDMRTSDDEKDGLAIADFNTAMRARNKVAGIFGQPYAKVVGQCLKCNFPSGLSDLHEPNLQEDVYRDVICRLGVLERKLQDIWV